MVRNAIKIVLALLILHALYQFLPAYFSYHLFKDDVKQAALFAGSAGDAELVNQVLRHAQDRDLPLERTDIAVRRSNNQTVINAFYEQPVKVLPWYTYVWQVEVGASAMNLPSGKPTRR